MTAVTDAFQVIRSDAGLKGTVTTAIRFHEAVPHLLHSAAHEQRAVVRWDYGMIHDQREAELTESPVNNFPYIAWRSFIWLSS